MNAVSKAKIAMYWAGSCGGCDISLLEIGPHLLELVAGADVVFWPCAADFKYHHVVGYPDGYIDLCLFNGSVRNSEQERLARLLRQKSKTLVAYGACAISGGIPALANLATPDEVFARSYTDCPSVDNPDGVLPQPETDSPVGELEIPHFYPQVLRLSDVVEVDYLIPGCPPQATRVWEVCQAFLSGSLPARAPAQLAGCTDKSVCDECTREKRLVRIAGFKRPHEAIPEAGWCLLEQGFVCLGAATRSGCGALCTGVNMPCRGCYGPSGEARDQGSAFIGALGSLLDADHEARALELIDQIVDPAGTFYRFTMSDGDLKGHR